MTAIIALLVAFLLIHYKWLRIPARAFSGLLQASRYLKKQSDVYAHKPWVFYGLYVLLPSVLLGLSFVFVNHWLRGGFGFLLYLIAGAYLFAFAKNHIAAEEKKETQELSVIGSLVYHYEFTVFFFAAFFGFFGIIFWTLFCLLHMPNEEGQRSVNPFYSAVTYIPLRIFLVFIGFAGSFKESFGVLQDHLLDWRAEPEHLLEKALFANTGHTAEAEELLDLALYLWIMALIISALIGVVV